MSYFTIIGIVISGWVMLSQIGSEHQRLAQIRRRQQEKESADSAATTSTPAAPPAPAKKA